VSVTVRRARAAASLAALAALAALAGCGGGGKTDVALPWKPSALTWVNRHFERTLDSCAVGQTGCSWVRLDWVEPAGGPSVALRESLNAWVRTSLLDVDNSGDTLARDPIAAVDSFLAQNRAFREQFPDAASIGWYRDVRIETFGDTLGIVTLRSTSERFGGGAHPLRTVLYGAFARRSGRQLKLDELVAPGGRAALDSLGEQAFRAAREVPAPRSLRDAMFTFEGDRFRLNGNFGIGRNGLTVEFNPYEIAPYAAGPTSITLGWSAVRDLLTLPPRR
jgi:hypothetical protein